MSNSPKGIRKYGRLIVYALFFAAAFYIAYQTPYCHDEWKWGSPERVELMKRGFENYNGRYLGNLLALLITRSELAKALVMAGGITWLLYVMEKGLAGRSHNLFMLLLSVFMLCSVPKTLYAQSFGWSAAFVNFVPPVILFLIYYNWTEPFFSGGDKLPPYSKVRTLLAFPLAIATQLFSEHITLFALLYGACVLGMAWMRKKKVYPAHALYFAGSLAGTIIMFSNGAYRRAATNPNSYKQIGISLSSVYQRISGTIVDHLLLNNWILNVLLAVALICLIMRSARKSFWDSAAVLILCGFSVYSVWNRLCPEWMFVGNENLNQMIRIALSLLYFVCVLFGIWKNVGSGERGGICVLYLSAAAVTVPLLAADPIGARCFYISYILQCLTLLKLVRYILERKTVDLYYPVLAAGFSVIVLGIIYVRMFSMIGAADDSRTELIEAAVEEGAEEITLPVLPFQGYYWTTVPQTEEWEKYFKEFYGIPEDVSLKFE